MATRAQKTKVGIFLVVCFSFSIGAAFVIAGFRTEDRSTYRMRFEESIAGLGIGGLVDYRGVPVGSVEDILVAADNTALVEISVIDDRVTLRKGVTAQLVMQNLATGTMSISLRGGEPDAPILPEGSTIDVEKSLIQSLTTSLPEALNGLQEVMEKIGGVSEALNRSVDGLEDGAVTRIAENVHLLTEDSREFIKHTSETMDGLNANVQRALGEYTKFGEDLQYLAEDAGDAIEKVTKLIDTAQSKIEPIDITTLQADLEASVANFRALTERLDSTLDLVDSVGETAIHNVDNIQHSLRESLESFSEALDAVTALATTLQEDPSSVLRGRGTPKVQD